jgi:hypothetical protein
MTSFSGFPRGTKFQSQDHAPASNDLTLDAKVRRLRLPLLLGKEVCHLGNISPNPSCSHHVAILQKNIRGVRRTPSPD